MNNKVITRDELKKFNTKRIFDYAHKGLLRCNVLELFTGDTRDEECINYPVKSHKYLNEDEKIRTSPEVWGGFFNSEFQKYTSKNSAFFCKEAIFIRNSYDVFYIDGSALEASYPNTVIRDRQKRSWGLGHNYMGGKNIFLPRELKIDSDQKIIEDYTYVIKHHDDADNYFHWFFENLPNLLLLMRTIEREAIKKINFVAIGNLKSYQTESIKSSFEKIGQVPPDIKVCTNDIFYAQKKR